MPVPNKTVVEAEGKEEREERRSKMESSQLCANECGFFGTPANRNLCSKCYKDFLKEEQKSVPAKEEARAEPRSSAHESSINGGVKAEARTETSSSAHDRPIDGGLEDSSSVEKKPERCGMCKKKVGMMKGFKCRCGRTFCGGHRLPEKHECKFDYKAIGREILTKQNPLVKADKMQTRV